MANIVKDSSNRVYQNPAKLLLLIPIGTIIFIYLFDIIFLKFNEYRIKKVTTDVILIASFDSSAKSHIPLLLFPICN